MDRKTASSVALLTCGLLGAPLAGALGVGTASMESKLGEPLRVRIPIYGAQGLSSEQVLVKLNPAWDASSESAMGGVDISGLTVESQIGENGRGQIWLTGRDNAQEPFVNFSVELRWPNGALTREYTLLLDLPGLVSMSPPPEKRPESPSRETQSAVAPPGRRTPAPDRPALLASTENYRTQRGDSLWAIASRLRQARGGNINTLMEQIFAANPDAFVRGTPSLLKEAVSLDVSRAALSAATPTNQAPVSPLPASVADSARPAKTVDVIPADVAKAAQPAGQADTESSVTMTAAPQSDAAERLSITADALGSESAAEVQMLQQNLALMSEDMAAMRSELQAVREELAQVRAEKLALESRNVVAEERAAAAQEAATAAAEQQPGSSNFTGWLLGIGASVVLAVALLLLRRQRSEPQRDEPLPSAAPVQPENFDEVFLDIGNLPKASAPVAAAQAGVDSVTNGPVTQAQAEPDFDLGELEDVAVSLPDLDDTSELSTQLSLLEFYAQLGDSPAFESLLAQIDQSALSPENRDVIRQAAESLEQQKQLRA